MEQAFFYTDGAPSNGCWVELNCTEGWGDVVRALYEAGLKNPDEILCADAEGLARNFLSQHDSFDLVGYVTCREECSWASEAAKAAYLDCFGSWDAQGFEDSYAGEWDSDQALAEDFIESTGMLNDMPDNLRGYFDIEAFAHDLMMDYSESGGHYFRNI